MSDSESDPDQGNGQWEIERIRGHKVAKGQVRYHVQWKLKPGQKEDWSDSENWVFEKQMNAPELVRDYWRRRGGRNISEETSPIKKAKAKPKSTRHNDLDEFIISDDDEDNDSDKEEDDDEIQIIRPSPKKKPRLNDDDDFIVSDDEIDPPRKSSRSRKSERSKSRSKADVRQRSKERKEPRPIVMPHIPTKSSSSESISSGESLQSFVASDTEEGLLIPTRLKRADRTPSPVVVSHRKKPTWQEKIHLTKDKYLFDTDDEAPKILTDDEERQKAIRVEAKRDEEAKQEERRKAKDAKRPSIAKRRKGYISSSNSEQEMSEDEDLQRRRRRRFSSSSESICMKKVTRPKPDRYTVDYRADDIQLSKSSLDSLMKQVALRERKPGSYKAKGALSMCETKTGKQSNSNIKTNAYDINPDELEEMTDAMRSNKLRDGQKTAVHSPVTRSIQDDVYESHKEFTPLRAPLDIRRGDEHSDASDSEEEPTPLYSMDDRNTNEFDQSDILGESSRVVIGSGEDTELCDDDDNVLVGGEKVEEESADQQPHQDFVMQPEHLPPEDPLFDTYERFALECWENKYKAIENGLKPVFILQFFANPPDEPPMDWSMVVFENKPGKLPRHVCECVPTGVMLDIHPQLVIDCEDRLRSNAGRSLQLISEKWLRDYEKEKKRKHREQKRLLSDS